MKKTYPLLFLLWIFIQLSFQGKTQTSFEKTYGIGRGYALQPTLDHGFIVLGTAEGSSVVISVIKADSSGNIQWSGSYSSGTHQLWGYDIQQTSDTGYIITGAVDTDSTSFDVLLMKTDAIGTVQWKKNFDVQGFDYGYSVQQTIDGGFIVAGETLSNNFILKTDAPGNLQWAKLYSGSHTRSFECIKQTADSGFILTGYAVTGASDLDIFLTKTDVAGDVLWSITLGGGTQNEYALSVKPTSDGGYIICGSTKSYGAGMSDLYLVKTSGAGIPQWKKTYGGISNDQGYFVNETADGGFIACGSTSSFGNGGKDVYVVKTSASGNMEWTRAFGGNGDDEGFSLMQAPDGGFVISGYTESSFATYTSDIYLIKTDSAGHSSCFETTPASIQGSGGGLMVSDSMGNVMAGISQDLFVQTNFGSIANQLCMSGTNEVTKEDHTVLYPNPFNSTAILQTETPVDHAVFKLYNIVGQEVTQYTFSGSVLTIERNQLSEGIYIYRLHQKGKLVTEGKIAIQNK